MAQDVHLVWRGVDGDCAGVRLNGGSVLGGSRVRIELEHVGPRVGAFPTTVETFELVEPVLARVLRRHRQLDSLHLHPTRHGPVVAVTDTFTVKPPMSPRGQVRLVASTDAGHAQAWVDSVDSRGGLRVVNQKPHEYEAKVDVSALEVEASVEIGRTAGSTTTYRQYVVAAVDPPVEVEVLKPGDRGFARYLDEYLSHKQLWAFAREDPRLELFARYAGHLDPRAGALLNVTAAPTSTHLGAGESMRVDVVIEALTDSAQGTFFALRAINGDTGRATVSELVRIDRPADAGGAPATGRVEDETAGRVRHAVFTS